MGVRRQGTAQRRRCSERACKGIAELDAASAQQSEARRGHGIATRTQGQSKARRGHRDAFHFDGIASQRLALARHFMAWALRGIPWHRQNIAPHCDGIAYQRIATDKRRSATRRPSTAPTSYAAASHRVAMQRHCMAPLRGGKAQLSQAQALHRMALHGLSVGTLWHRQQTRPEREPKENQSWKR